MGIWKNINISSNNIIKQDERYSRIYMPKDTIGAGLFFLHPNKLIRPNRRNNRVKSYSVGYSDEFSFILYQETDGNLSRISKAPLKSNDIDFIFADMHLKEIKKQLSDYLKLLFKTDGGLTEAIDLKEQLKFAEGYGETSEIPLKYFNVTFYKKGTCHIEFTNLELLKKFNIFGSQKKGWLPNGYGKKRYKDMTQEEKEVVNSFEGEKEYSNTALNSNYYLFNSSKLAMLEDKEIA